MLQSPVSWDILIAMPKKPPTPLQKIREAHHLSQSKVAAAVGLDQSSYHCIETGKNGTRPSTAERLVKFFGSGITEMHVLYPERFPTFKASGPRKG